MVSLVDTLEPATIATSGRFGCASALPSASISAASSGPAQATGAYSRDAVGGGFGAVRGAEGVVARRRRTARPSSARAPSSFFFSPLLKRQFSSSTTSPGATVDAVDPVAHSGTSRPEQLARGACATGASESACAELAFGRAAQVRGDHHRARRARARVADAGERGADARVFGDRAGVVLRHVEVGADEDALAARDRGRPASRIMACSERASGSDSIRPCRQRVGSRHAHRPPSAVTGAATSRSSTPPSCRACGCRSPIRCRTRTRPSPACPDTLVSVASKIDERGSWLKSTDTSGAVL